MQVLTQQTKPTLETKNTSQQYPLNIDGIEIQIFDRVEQIEDVWSQYEGGDLMFSVAFLKAIEQYPPIDMDFRYGVFHQNGKVLGVSYYQIRLISLKDSLRTEKTDNSIWGKIKSWLASRLKNYTLISGNALVTGDYGIRFEDTIDDQQVYQLQEAAADIVSNNYHPKKKVRAAFMKDFYQKQRPTDVVLKDSSYSQFSVQPNMVLHLKDEWTSFDDYLGAMKSKYRVRFKRADKKFGDLEKRQLTIEDIEKYNAKIYSLYLSTANQAGFNLFYLHQDYFLGMKRHFPEVFKVYGYFDGEELLAFFTTFDNGDDLEAHFLGYNPERNAAHQLYLNMLYDLVFVSIKNKHKIIHLSRTALEIKSSIGATPIDMFIYLRHYNSLINKYVPKALDYFVPQEEWLERSPFK